MTEVGVAYLARWLIHGNMYFGETGLEIRRKKRTLMAGRAVLPIRQQQVGLLRKHGLCKNRACPHYMTHVANLGEKLWSRASYTACRSGLPTCFAHGKERPNCRNEQGRHHQQPPLDRQAFGTLNHTPGTPGAIGNSKSTTCLRNGGGGGDLPWTGCAYSRVLRVRVWFMMAAEMI